MDTLLVEVDWIPVLIGAFSSFVFGRIWYSSALFGKKWARALQIDLHTGIDQVSVLAQAVSLVLLAWVIGITVDLGSFAFALLILFMLVGFVLSNGYASQKNIYAIKIDVAYIFAMTAIIILAHTFFG